MVIDLEWSLVNKQNKGDGLCDNLMIRPNLEKFLTKISIHFEIILYTKFSRNEVELILS